MLVPFAPGLGNAVMHGWVAICENLGTVFPMSFAEWQHLGPEAAAAELDRRAGTLLSPGQRSAAIAALLDRGALESAFAAASPGPLRGVPYLLKDLFDAQGLPTRAGSSFLGDIRPVPPEDSRIVRDLARAGAVLAGKTHLFEFAWGLTGQNAHFGDCEHPHFQGRTSGGSSSGSAVVVAAGIVPLAIGTDTGGSVRVPAAFCGIYGYRGVPGDAWISDAVSLAPSYDTAGWFTRTAADMGSTLDALVGPARPGPAPRGCYLEMPGLDPDVAQACRQAALEFTGPADGATAGALLHAFSPAAEVYGVLAGAESWKLHRKWSEKYRTRYGPLLLDRLERARAISPAQLAAVEPSHKTIRRAWEDYFASHDYLVLAAAPCAALPTSELTHANRLRLMGLTAPASIAGLPALVLPLALPSGLSAGLQVVVRDPMSPALRWALGARG